MTTYHNPSKPNKSFETKKEALAKPVKATKPAKEPKDK